MTMGEEYHSLGKWGNLQNGEDHWSLHRKEKEEKKRERERETRKLKRHMMTHHSQVRIILTTVTKQRKFQLRTSN